MFTGIIETTGTVVGIRKDGGNVHFTLQSPISGHLKVDQSLAHDGTCLTVVQVGPDTHTVTAIAETIDRTCLSQWKPGYQVNLERAMAANGRLDGHIVQGHVDGTGKVEEIKTADGSWYFYFRYDASNRHLLVDKGSVCINGVSLTVVEPTDEQFAVAIIPYTYEHTNFSQLQKGDLVNLEFDIIGKYVSRMAEAYR